MKKSAPRTAASKSRIKLDPIPQDFRTIEELWDFWDSHSTADYPKFLEPVRATIRLKKRGQLFRVADDLVMPLRRRARRHGVTLEALVNSWIRERLQKAG